MLMPESLSVPCPECGTPILITTQSELRAKTNMGTVFTCQSCRRSWLLQLTPEIRFAPLSTPRSRPRPGLIAPNDLPPSTAQGDVDAGLPDDQN